MGMDTSFHPVDVKFIHERVIPYVRGEGTIDELVARAVTIGKVRFRANAWGLGLLKHQQVARMPRELAEKLGVPPLPAELLSKLEGFESDLHVWGRPFFVVGDAGVGETIDRYLAATPETVDAIAREQLAKLDPRLAELVAPDMEGTLPPDAELAKSIRWKMDLFREAHRNLGSGLKMVKMPDGEMAMADKLFARDFAHAALEFQSHFRPGWMSRGNCWPTLFARELIPFFEPAMSWVEPLQTTVATAGAGLQATLTENYMVGGFVPAEKVKDLLGVLDDRRIDLENELAAEGWDEPDRGIAFKKLEEAISDAASRGLGFCEATEIYSAPLGVMN